MSVKRFVLGLLCGLGLWACSSDGGGSRRTIPGGDPAAAPGTGGDRGQSTAATGGPAQPTSGSDGRAGTGTGGAFSPPVIDPNATHFERDDTSSLDPAEVDRLRSGDAPCTAPIIYPYEGAVFPGGLPSPTIMWRGSTRSAHVAVRYEMLDSVDYQFAAGASDPGELTIPQDAWNEITRRTRNTALLITVSADVNGSLSRCDLRLRIAAGNMVGAIYYNTYNAPGVDVPGNGAVMRLTLGQTSSEIYLQFQGLAAPVSGPCISCHSVSFDGSTIVASTHAYAPPFQSFEVFSYPLGPAAQPNAGPQVPNANFGALTPDGSTLLATGNPQCTTGADSFPRAPNNFPLVEGPDEARLLDVNTGAVIDAPGLQPDWYMWMPQFSPTGDKIVFNHAKPDGQGGTDRRELAVMDYDPEANTFSNLQVIVSNQGPAPSLPYQPLPSTLLPSPIPNLQGCTSEDPSAVGALNPGTCTEPCYPAYPFFTPDGRAVVFAMISEPDFASAFPGRSRPAMGELWYADLETGRVIPLTNINRPQDPAEVQREYYPTVLPVAVGGYFWVVWTSRRSFGHHATGDRNNRLVLPEEDPFRKRLWAAAIRPKNARDEFQDDGDPSFPGFYLEGQSASGNVRGFATLSPCQPVSSGCTAGLDCCTGFCAIEPGEASGVCTEEPPECSKTNERCTTDDDCCPPEDGQPPNYCIGGFCSFLALE